eukprot:CAMPEP_0183346858 /NCGR_PEP_ID=MMETSP0164_2-20130417/11858_1 /TAXON_ID=221442 /ORGANISM="Coccolithus pelagicus ssp braarudi, Strain PLY182g" /LENGTH=119 /DNA_ID=CAMNT_0025518201 /DNA_START=268 /DNA_END=628 /DNA_ORIENTATION=-
MSALSQPLDHSGLTSGGEETLRDLREQAGTPRVTACHSQEALHAPTPTAAACPAHSTYWPTLAGATGAQPDDDSVTTWPRPALRSVPSSVQPMARVGNGAEPNRGRAAVLPEPPYRRRS